MCVLLEFINYFIIQVEKSLFLQILCTQWPNKAFRKFPNQAHGKCGEMPCQALQVLILWCLLWVSWKITSMKFVTAILFPLK